MKKNRRQFLKFTGLTGLGMAGAGIFKGLAFVPDKPVKTPLMFLNTTDKPPPETQMWMKKISA